MHIRAWLKVLCCGSGALLASAEQLPITVDGDVADWAAAPPAILDPPGDGDAVDFRGIWTADDAEYLFVRFQTTGELKLSENNALRVLVDTDDNPATGVAISGMGADLEWRLGQRTGTVRLNGQTQTIAHAHLGFLGGPTVTATEFEIAFRRDARPFGTDLLFSGPRARIVLLDAAGGDVLPDLGQNVLHTFDQGAVAPAEVVPLTRVRECDVRVMTQNVLFDSLWDPAQQPRFQRLIQAVSPDIILFQEIYSHPPAVTRALIEEWLPSSDGATWYAEARSDCTVVSRFPILNVWTTSGDPVVLLDTAERWGRPFLVINAHMPCCTNDFGRQVEADRIVALLRDARAPGGPVTVPEGTPLLIAGDLNLVGFAQQVRTLLDGDIVNESIHGPDSPPDWDGSSLVSVRPRHAERRRAYTWRNDADGFWPGHLDYQIYSDSSLRVNRTFVLYTPELSAQTLAQYGLLADDSSAADHLLFVADYQLRMDGNGDLDDDGDVDLADLSRLLSNYGGAAPLPGDGDLDADGDVDLTDLATLLAHYGAGC